MSSSVFAVLYGLLSLAVPAFLHTPWAQIEIDSEVVWQIHRSVIVRASMIERVSKDALGHFHTRVRSCDEVLPVSASFQSRFRSM